MEDTFEIRPYGKGELAMAYTHGQMSQKASLNWLNREIEQFPGLLDDLTHVGYRPCTRLFTIAQLRLISSKVNRRRFDRLVTDFICRVDAVFI